MEGCRAIETEVKEKQTKKRFTVEYKKRIVEEAGKCREIGEIGALLRREGLYSSHLGRWRKAYSKGINESLQTKNRGRKIEIETSLEKKIKELEEENKNLQTKLKQAERIIEVQKKLSELLEIATLENKKS